ncbi:MAG: biosynthetic arginine decarboxylase [Pseudomonadota bacterium]
MTEWNIQQARATYNIEHWGDGYFDIGNQGRVVVHPRSIANEAVDLYAVAQQVRAQGLAWPVLVRITDILQDRVRRLTGAFQTAMQNNGYQGRYTPVYPIKVNQQRTVVEHLLASPDPLGLEAGSKPELMVVLARSAPGGIIICNGYKDREYIRLALIGRALGHRIHIVIEKMSELEVVLEESRAMGITPLLGVRVRLASIGKGKWQNTGGEKSKFGLSAAQVLHVVARLKKAQCLDTLQLVHCHLGSQLANIRDIQSGMREMSYFYVELRRLGANITTVDVGGGLGVDYEGTHSRSFCSINYSVQEYANDVVQALWEVCTEKNLPHPDIVSESGRALTAHHAVLITDVIDVESAPGLEDSAPPHPDAPRVLHNLWQTLQDVSIRSALEAYHDAAHWVSECQAMYTHGVLSLEQRAQAEQLYFRICRAALPLLQISSRAHRELVDELNDKLADKYFVNFSVFQSIPDVWAIDQIFPIMPLHRLEEAPLRRATLHDLTCDSDGHVEYYVDKDGVELSLPLHEIRPGEPYLIGIFLVGAYQEILGDMHNLFGDTHSVNLEFTPGGGYRLTEPEQGDTVNDVLSFVHFRAADLLQSYNTKIAAAELSNTQRADFLTALENGLSGYTYLED